MHTPRTTSVSQSGPKKNKETKTSCCSFSAPALCVAFSHPNSLFRSGARKRKSSTQVGWNEPPERVCALPCLAVAKQCVNIFITSFRHPSWAGLRWRRLTNSLISNLVIFLLAIINYGVMSFAFAELLCFALVVWAFVCNQPSKNKKRNVGQWMLWISQDVLKVNYLCFLVQKLFDLHIGNIILQTKIYSIRVSPIGPNHKWLESQNPREFRLKIIKKK